MIDLKEIIQIPENIEVNIDSKVISLKSDKGELSRRFAHPKIDIKKENNSIVLSANKVSKREKRMLFTFKSHINNMINGLVDGFEYRLKVCSGHFPMNVSVENKDVVIKNFLGEKIPRRAKILNNVNVKVEGDEVIVNGIGKEEVGQTAANIEKACRITKRARTRFQDGIWITNKAGKVIR